MNKSNIFGRSTALAAVLLLTSQANADVVYDDGKPHLTPVSGFEGAPVSIAGSITAPYRAISKISWDEKTNHPCYFNVQATHMNTNDVRQHTVNRCGSKGQPDGDVGSSSGFDYVKTNSDFGIYISGIRVCMNDRNTRMKGLQIRASVVDGDRVVDYDDWTPPGDELSDGASYVYLDDEAQRPNCNGNWKKWVDCRAGELPSAIYLHFDDADEPSSLKGASLACREVRRKS